MFYLKAESYRIRTAAEGLVQDAMGNVCQQIWAIFILRSQITRLGSAIIRRERSHLDQSNIYTPSTVFDLCSSKNPGGGPTVKAIIKKDRHPQVVIALFIILDEGVLVVAGLRSLCFTAPGSHKVRLVGMSVWRQIYSRAGTIYYSR